MGVSYLKEPSPAQRGKEEVILGGGERVEKRFRAARPPPANLHSFTFVFGFSPPPPIHSSPLCATAVPGA